MDHADSQAWWAWRAVFGGYRSRSWDVLEDEPKEAPASSARFVPPLIVAAVAVSWVSATETAREALEVAPGTSFFLLYTATSSMALLLVPRRIRTAPLPLPEVSHGSRRLFTTVAVFLTLWATCNYSYIRALAYLHPATVTLVFSTAPAFVYLFSHVILGAPHDAWRALAVVLAVAGVACTSAAALTASRDDQESAGASTRAQTLLGVILAALAALAAALYKVLFYLAFGEAPPEAVARFLGTLGLASLCLLWAFEPFLIAVGAEASPRLGSQTAWLWTIAHAFVGLTFNFLVNYGVVRTYPLFVSVGTVLGIPLSLVCDCFLAGFESSTCRLLVSPLSLLGSLGVVIAFSLLVLRDRVAPPFVRHPDESGSNSTVVAPLREDCEVVEQQEEEEEDSDDGG